ncbi:hypothetical protein [Legionella spiritensis]|uniref:hypothetical protein n=1 Tax=Legionella spiritensis TaxID=452 RepID=UPI000F6EE2E6|nr:hypothetical protein [Legionella spiritensis]VEG92176.1 secreted protein [Legionella spiritensis]
MTRDSNYPTTQTVFYRRMLFSTLLLTSLAGPVAISPSFADKTSHSGAKQVERTANRLEFSVQNIVDQGDKKQVFIKLRDTYANKPITLADLKTVHTQKIHLLIIDDSLSDYSHIHPTPTQTPGIYEFSWQPKVAKGNYNIWADIVTNDTNQQALLLCSLAKYSPHAAAIDRKPYMASNVDGLQFNLTFNEPTLFTGKAAMGDIVIKDAQGKPVKNLEPIMGAFAHIVGFGEDLKTVVHIHPMGKEPTKSSDRGGPELQFHIQPEQAGFIKLFAQIKINGKELFVPFGLTIEKATGYA